MYDHMVEFFAIFIIELAVSGCIVLLDEFASAWSKGKGTSCPYRMKKGE